MRRCVHAWLVSATVALAATSAGSDDLPRVVAVNYPLAYFSERLLDDAAEVVFPVPPGLDPSFWRPGVSDISAIQAADLIVLNGAGFATWVERVSLPRSRLVDASRGLQDRFIATESITHSHGEGGEHTHEGSASYLWLDPELALVQASAIAEAIKARGLDAPASIDARMAALSDDLMALDAEAKAALAPVRETVIIATHPRYQYLAAAYGLTIHALEWEAGAVPTEREMEDLRALVARTNASVLIWEAAPPADARAVASELGLTDLVFPPLAVAPEGATFLEAFRASIDALVAAAARATEG